MRRQTLILVWLAVNLVTALAVTLVATGAAVRFAIVAAALATALLDLYVWFAWRRMAQYLRRFEDFTAALPANRIDLPDSLPQEFLMLASALQRTSEHIRSVIERANLELARRETVLAGMAEGVLAVDGNLCVTFSNDAFADAFQTRRPLPEGRPLYEVVREPSLRELLQEVLSTGASARRLLHLPAAGGRWFEIHALLLGETPHAGAIAVLHDVTEMERQEQARKDFVANVSHELRTPLAAIRGYAETLLDGALEDTTINRKFVEVIQAHAIRLNNIASDLLVLSEIDARTPSAPPSPVPLSEVIESAIRTVESAAAMRQVHLRVNACDQTVVLGNRLRLEQIFVNLLDNGVKFNRTTGSVTVDCKDFGDTIQISVTDTGIGIRLEDTKRIFERFYRVDKARSRQVGGTGLGLSIVKESLERMGGSIAVESQLGHGTRFILQVPAVPKSIPAVSTAFIDS